jgi:hemerythrin-like metal-binding protein
MTKNAYIVWKEEYSVGHDELDVHHQRMFTIINDLYDALITRASPSQLTALFRSASDYAQMHFQAEEDVMRAAQYPGLAAHQKAHRLYIQRLEGLLPGALSSPTDLSSDLLRFLKEWLVNHILKMDQAYAGHLEKGQ